jgi:integrase
VKHYRESTIAVYTQRAESLLKAYSQETGNHWSSDPMAFVQWFHHRGLAWRHSTFRMSRLSVLYYLERSSAPIEMLKVLSNIKHKAEYASSIGEVDEAGAVDRKTPAGAKRIRRFPESDLKRYLDILSPTSAPRRSGSFDYLLWLFLQWNIHVGLRPSEVGDMEIINVQGADLLAVRNRKVNEVRGNGDFRMLALRGDALQGALTVIQERDRFYAMGITWKEIQNGMMRRMNQIRHEAGGPSYTLYSTRHQFAANAKASGLSQREVADRMGHASIETAQSAYGKKISGKPTGTGIEQASGVTVEQLHAMRERAAGRIRSNSGAAGPTGSMTDKEMAA